MRVKCPRETMYTRDYSLRKSKIKLYAVRIIVKEKNEVNGNKGKQKVHSTVNVNTAQWPSRE